jgi:hypothetical protein
MNENWQSVSIATRYGAGRSGDRLPVVARFSAPVQTDPGAHPASCTMDTDLFLGVKRPECGVDDQPSCSTAVKERIELYPSCGPLWLILGWSSPVLVNETLPNNFNDVDKCIALLVCYVIIIAEFSVVELHVTSGLNCMLTSGLNF